MLTAPSYFLELIQWVKVFTHDGQTNAKQFLQLWQESGRVNDLLQLPKFCRTLRSYF